MKDKKGGISREKLKEAVEYVFSQERNKKKPERVMKIMRACNTYGFYEYGKHCGNENCTPCNRFMEQFQNLLKEEFDRQLKELKDDK